MTRSSVAPALAAAFARGERVLVRAIRRSGGAWTAREAMRALHISRRTLRRWVQHGRLLTVTSGGRVVYPRAQCRLRSGAAQWSEPYAAMAVISTMVRGRMTAEELFALLATRQPMLPGLDGEPRTAFAALAVGDVAQVLRMMEWIITPADAGAPPRAAPSTSS